MSEQVHYFAKVAKVIDTSTVVINKGSRHGVEVGARYLVFRVGEEISDPDSNEPLGVLEIVVGRTRVLHTQNNMATLKLEGSSPGRSTTNPLAAIALQMRDTGGSENAMFASVGDLVKPI